MNCRIIFFITIYFFRRIFSFNGFIPLLGLYITYLYTIKIALLFRMCNPSRIAWRNWCFGLFNLQLVESTLYLLYTFRADRCVYLSCSRTFMPQKLLNKSQISAAFHQMHDLKVSQQMKNFCFLILASVSLFIKKPTLNSCVTNRSIKKSLPLRHD
jgi:hypothetical protein